MKVLIRKQGVKVWSELTSLVNALINLLNGKDEFHSVIYNFLIYFYKYSYLMMAL